MSTRTTTGRRPPGSARTPRTPVDPRVRDRWVAARRAEGRRRLRWLVGAAALVALVLGAWALSVSPLLAVDHVAVVGTGHTTAAQIESAAGIHPGDALVWIDTGRAVAGIEALPYVRTARVERSFPDTVKIVVDERLAVAWVDDNGRPALVDGSGRVLERVPTPPVGIPRLTGETKVPEPGGRIRGTAGARVAAGLVGLGVTVESVGVQPTGIVLALAGGPEIRLGQPTEIAVKVRAAEAVVAAMAAAGRPLSYVDVSVPSNAVAG